MAVPRLAGSRPFLALDAARVGPPRQAASIRGAAHRGVAVWLGQMSRVDLVVCGSVAVNRHGARLGKGGGYSDLKFGLLVEAGRIDSGTALATTVHGLQVLDEELPETEHDFRVDLVVTATETLAPPSFRRPPGVIWKHLDREKVEAIPVLRQLDGGRG